ncbi:MAG: hypothetical protein U0793_06940 [Gemmataceae bacterium]
MNQTDNNLTRKEIDEREWSNPQNWHWSFYYSRKDSRTCVPRRRGPGSTLNFGQRDAIVFLLVLFSMPLAILGGLLLSRAF